MLIGIDPGTHTGYAEVDTTTGDLTRVLSGKAIEIEEKIRAMVYAGKKIEVWIEDARQRKWYGTDEKKIGAKRQGAGSVKRDCSRWEEFCAHHGIKLRMIPPAKGGTKMKAETFAKVTGWQGRTNEHGRDAAMIVYGVVMPL